MKRKMIIIIGLSIIMVITIIVSIVIYCGQNKMESGNLNELQEYLDTFYDIENIEEESLGYILNQKVFIYAKDMKVNSDKVTGKAHIIVQAPDLTNVIQSSIEKIKDVEIFSSTEIRNKVQENMLNVLNNGEYSEIETELEVDIKKIDDKWKYVYNEEFGKAISCNINELFKKAVLEMLRGE